LAGATAIPGAIARRTALAPVTRRAPFACTGLVSSWSGIYFSATPLHASFFAEPGCRPFIIPASRVVSGVLSTTVEQAEFSHDSDDREIHEYTTGGTLYCILRPSTLPRIVTARISGPIFRGFVPHHVGRHYISIVTFDSFVLCNRRILLTW
jgi:hypothetical protein